VSLVRAQNGRLWIFRIKNKILEAKCSTDDGRSWSATLNVKTGLKTTTGMTDAAAFTFKGETYVGVAYGERDTLGSRYGFLRHRDIDLPDAGWNDESDSLKFFGSERALNSIFLASDAGNNVYLLTRNVGVSDSQGPRNTLYKRTNTGIWKKFKVNSTATYNWRAPVIAIDRTNNRIYCMGINMLTSMAEYKTCLIGKEATLDTATVAGLLSAPRASFEDLSVPAANLSGVSGLIVCGDHTIASDIWFRHLPIDNPVPVIIGAVTVASNEVNANATYTIPLTLSNAGILNANTGTLHFRFPGITVVPDKMMANAVLVNGTPATAIISNNSTKQVTITTPVTLPNGHSFSVVFTPSAGLVNPATPGNGYKLTVWTSSQPTQVNSSGYTLAPATTKVTAATVALSTAIPGSPADYTLNFKLGDHGRMLPATTTGTDNTFTVKFDNVTRVRSGTLSGVTVNTVNATATGDSVLHKIIIALPSGMSLDNNAEVTLFLPSPIVHNPTLSGSYKLTVATSVEPTEVESKPYVVFISGKSIPGATKNFHRNNQSKLFYHGDFWWVTAQAQDDSKWYLWKFDGWNWTRTIPIHSSTKVWPDCVLDAANNKVYIVLPGGSTTYIARFGFASGNWTLDSGYPYAIPDFPQDSEYGINLVRANNGSFWVFRIAGATLLAKRSADGGQTWSATVTVKNGLNNATGLTDAVAFVYNNSNHIGVGYAENSATGAIYGFLRHKDADADEIWTDETGAIPQFAGTTADDHLSMAVHHNTVFTIVKTNGGGVNTTIVGLLRRDATGLWFQHPILRAQGWTRPTLAVDQTHNRLYAFGTREGTLKIGEMKHVAIGDYDNFLSAPIDTIFSNDANNFLNTSVSAHGVNETMNLLVCNSNETRNELWHNFIRLNGASKASTAAPISATAAEEENLEGVQVYPNPFNPETAFRFKVNGNSLAGAFEPVKLQIFNINGQLVRTLIAGELSQGIHQQRWDGRSNQGYRVASGIYLYRLQIGTKIMCGRIQMIK
jgi:hypothetical protein